MKILTKILSIKIKKLISFIRTFKKDPEFYVLEKFIKKGYFIADIALEFDSDGKIKNNYSIYDKYQNHVNRWPKFMFLLKETYKHAYNQYWHLAAFGAGQPLGFYEYQLPQFDYVTMDFFTYIVELYRYIDEKITLKKLKRAKKSKYMKYKTMKNKDVKHK